MKYVIKYGAYIAIAVALFFGGKAAIQFFTAGKERTRLLAEQLKTTAEERDKANIVLAQQATTITAVENANKELTTALVTVRKRNADMAKARVANRVAPNSDQATLLSNFTSLNYAPKPFEDGVGFNLGKANDIYKDVVDLRLCDELLAGEIEAGQNQAEQILNYQIGERAYKISLVAWSNKEATYITDAESYTTAVNGLRFDLGKSRAMKYVYAAGGALTGFLIGEAVASP